MKAIKFPICFFACLVYGQFTCAQELTMFPSFWGMEFYQDDAELKKKDFMTLLKTHDAAYAHWKKGNTQELYAGVAAVGQIGLLIWGLEALNRDGVSDRHRANAAIGPLAGSLGAAVLGGIFMNASYKAKRRAILTYNKQFDQKTALHVVPTLDHNGLGVALRF